MKCHRSNEYLRFIRSRPCTISGNEIDVVAHHVRCLGGGGMGIKPSDYLCIPITSFFHAKLHQIGEKEFYRQHDIDIESALKMNLLIYLAGHRKVNYVDLISIIEKL